MHFRDSFTFYERMLSTYGRVRARVRKIEVQARNHIYILSAAVTNNRLKVGRERFHSASRPNAACVILSTKKKDNTVYGANFT